MGNTVLAFQGVGVVVKATHPIMTAGSPDVGSNIGPGQVNVLIDVNIIL